MAELNVKATDFYVDGEGQIMFFEDVIQEPTVVAAEGSLPDSNEARGQFPMADGLLDYFPNALAEVARLSWVATEQHHPGEPMHWERGKSTDHRNKIIRHLVDAGKKFFIGNHELRHSTAVAWRALANLQEELEREEGVPMARNAR